MSDKYLPMSDIAWIVYGIVTIVYIVLIGFLMAKISPWWFLAFFLWHWRWVKTEK